MEKLNLTVWASLAIVLVVLLCWLAYLHTRLSSLKKRYAQMMGDMAGKNLEELFLSRLKEIAVAKDDIAVLNRRCQELDKGLSSCVQNVSVVRFNAFNDMGSDLSYAVALLNRQGDGVIFSSIYGRNEARCYAKPIKGGKSGYLLTEEEKQAIRQK